jgi:hypothetical protein
MGKPEIKITLQQESVLDISVYVDETGETNSSVAIIPSFIRHLQKNSEECDTFFYELITQIKKRINEYEDKLAT